MESFILFYEKCRLCVEQPGVCNMFEREDLPEDIYLCTGVRVHPSDNLPQKICDKCSKVISNAKDLRVLATRNNIHLRSLFPDYDDEEPRLQINEDNISSSGSKTKYITDEETPSPNKQSKDSTETKHASPSNKKLLAVRRDLFANSTTVTVTSSTKKNTSTKKEPKSKKIKLENLTILHECHQCPKKFDTPKKLYLHLRMHNKSVPCPLDACGKQFATKGDLEKHFRTHTGEKPFACHLCGKSFTQRGTLRVHRETMHVQR